jgi:hypothetical protein
MVDRPFIRRFIVALAMLTVTCGVLATAAVVLRPPRFTTRVQAIGFVLNQHDIVYEKLYINRGWPDNLNTLSYTADLIIQRKTGEVTGLISCHNEDRDCYIFVRRLGIDRVAIPDLSPPIENPALEWIESHYADLRMGRLQWP